MIGDELNLRARWLLMPKRRSQPERIGNGCLAQLVERRPYKA